MALNLTAKKTLLLIVDVQNDFCSGGALEVKDGDAVITPLNMLSKMLASKGGKVAAAQDWHPANHISFASSHENKIPGDVVDTNLVKGQILWPDHCVKETAGADFHKELNLTDVSLILRKGSSFDLDSYSAFFENDRKTSTGLGGWLKSACLDTVMIGGLATDYCVFNSAMDCKKLGFNTILVNDAVKGVGVPEGSIEKAIDMMKAIGVEFYSSKEIHLNLQRW